MNQARHELTSGGLFGCAEAFGPRGLGTLFPPLRSQNIPGMTIRATRALPLRTHLTCKARLVRQVGLA